MNNDSDNDEGFVPNKIQIKEDVSEHKKKSPNKVERPSDFQSRYIFGDGIYRKEPPEAYTRFSQFLSIQKNNDKNEKKPFRKQEIGHPYEKYFMSEKYSLIFARYKDRIGIEEESDDFTGNEIGLGKVCASYQKDHYSLLKNFQYPHTDYEETQQIVFDSRFQSGNLLYAFKNKQSPKQFVLFIQNDTNTNGYNQWLNFSMRYAKPDTVYKFSVVNFKKKHSFFKENMKLSVFSLIDAQKNNGNGWRKMGKNIKYERSSIRKYSDKKFKFYCLSFELEFEHKNDYIQVAVGMPYSYSRLIHNLRKCEQLARESEKIYWEMNSIAHSLSNNAVPYLTITSHLGQYSRKKIIIILARQHPGQTWASFLMQEILYCLVQKHNEDVSEILENYIFKIFPMVNVDGVIYGNTRCDLGGFDLNRNWKNPSKVLHPQVFAIKQQIIKLSLQFKIDTVFDLHGHSKQYNVFCYSCKNNPTTSRILPYLISKQNCKFYFPYCTFGISKYKQTTARAVIYSIIENENILTIENSFYGSRVDGVISPFEPKFFTQFSSDLIKALKTFLLKQTELKEIEKDIKSNLSEFLSYERKGAADSGSESDPEGDQISFKDKLGKIFPKSFISIEMQKGDEKERKKKVKQNNNDKKVKVGKVTKNYQTLVEKPRISIMNRVADEEINKTFVERSSFTHYKKNSKELSKSTLNKFRSFKKEDEKQEKKKEDFRPQVITKTNQISLPFYLREKPQLIPIKLKNDSLQIFKDAYNATKQKYEEESQKKNSFKGSTKKVKIMKEAEGEEFPWLCVLSENKKKNHLQKIKNTVEFKEDESYGMKDSKLRTFVKNQKLDMIKNKMKEKERSNKNNEGKNTDVFLKVWKDNFTRYGKELNVFYGGIKK